MNYCTTKLTNGMDLAHSDKPTSHQSDQSSLGDLHAANNLNVLKTVGWSDCADARAALSLHW